MRWREEKQTKNRAALGTCQDAPQASTLSLPLRLPPAAKMREGGKMLTSKTDLLLIMCHF